MTQSEVLNAFKGCELILEKEAYFLLGKPVSIPWLIIVPKVEVDINGEIELFAESLNIKNKLEACYEGYIHNLAKIGNKNPNYHIHLLFRKSDDFLWPEPVWCRENELEFDDIEIRKIKEILKND